MKKAICILICLITALIFVGCKENLNDTKADEYSISVLGEKKILTDIDFKITDQDGVVWLDYTDVKTVCVSMREGKGRYLELRLTDDGAADFKEALSKPNTVLSIMAGDVLLASPVLQDEVEENSAVVLGDYKEVVMRTFNAIT